MEKEIHIRDDRFRLIGQKDFHIKVHPRANPILWEESERDIAQDEYQNYYGFEFRADGYEVTSVSGDVEIVPLGKGYFAVKIGSGYHELSLGFAKIYRYAVYEVGEKEKVIEKGEAMPGSPVLVHLDAQNEHYVIDHIECRDMDLEKDVPYETIGTLSKSVVKGDELYFHMPKWNAVIIVYRKKNPDAVFVSVDVSCVPDLDPQYSRISNGDPSKIVDFNATSFSLGQGKNSFAYLVNDTLYIDIVLASPIPLRMKYDSQTFEPVSGPKDNGDHTYFYRFYPIFAKDGLAIEILPIP